MPQRVFISYSQRGPRPALDLAGFLQDEGFDVWWDIGIASGEVYRDVIDRELDAADAVLVIWTPASVKSKWVIAEADHADRQSKLVPVRTGDLDPARIPKPYNTYQTVVVDDRAAVIEAVRRMRARKQVKKAEKPVVAKKTRPARQAVSEKPSSNRLGELEEKIDCFFRPINAKLQKDNAIWERILDLKNHSDSKEYQLASAVERNHVMPNHDDIVSIIERWRHLTAGDAELTAVIDKYLHHVVIYKSIRESGDPRTFPLSVGAPWPKKFAPLIENRLEALLAQRAKLKRGVVPDNI